MQSGLFGLKRFFNHHFEKAFILFTLLGAALVVALVPYKMAFLNFFYLPVILSAYYLSTRSAVMGAVFTVLIISMIALWDPQLLAGDGMSPIALIYSIMTWGGFLILTGAVVGEAHAALKRKVTQALDMQKELEDKTERLDLTSRTLSDFQHHFQSKLDNQTKALLKDSQALKKDNLKVQSILRTTMDPKIAKLMLENRIRTEIREISVLFSDLSQFTEYSEAHSADVVITELNGYLSQMEHILLGFNAHIDKYMGDGIMAEFGVPESFDKHAVMAIACGYQMQQHMRDSHYPWSLKIGIATGVATTGIIGSQRQFYTALGDTVNLASRIEKHCQSGDITVDEITYQATKLFFDFEPVILAPTKNRHSELEQLKAEYERSPDHNTLEAYAYALSDCGLHRQALELVKERLSEDPDRAELKVLYTDLILTEDEDKLVVVKGKHKPVNLYRFIGVRRPIEDNKVIPKKLRDKYDEEFQQKFEFPEGLLLPIEVLDSSIRFSETAGFVSYLMCIGLELDAEHTKDIVMASFYAEIGKDVIPEYVLNRNGPLTKEEFAMVKRHPKESVKRLRSLKLGNERIYQIITHHHENIDGTGYPVHIGGGDIPLGSKVLALSEAYVSLTSIRPYRDAWTMQTALLEMEKFVKNGKFDEQLYQVLNKQLMPE